MPVPRSTLCFGHTETTLRRAAFFERAIDAHGVPETITIDKGGANTAAIEGLRADSGADIKLLQSKYLNNIVEQDHRAIKCIVRPMLGFKSFRCASILIAGIEIMHMTNKGQLAALNSKPRLQRITSTRWRFDPRTGTQLCSSSHHYCDRTRARSQCRLTTGAHVRLLNATGCDQSKAEVQHFNSNRN